MKHIFTRLLSILFLCTISISAMAQEAYAVMSPDSTTLTFYYDNKKASREGTAYELNVGDNRPEWVKTKDYNIFYIADNDNFTTVVFDGSFKDARPISCAYWFSGFKNLKKIEGIENLNTSNVTDMSRMFTNAGENATTFNLNLSTWNTSNVTSMSQMFYKTGNKATNWSITIPKTNGGAINNRTSRMYGKTTSIYENASSSKAGRTFTLAS